MNKRVWLLLLLFVLWCIGSVWYYNNIIKKDNCSYCSGKAQIGNVSEHGPITFNWDNPDAVTNDKFAGFKNDILASIGNNDTLNIIGKYFDAEHYDGAEENLGIARAKQAAKLFAAEVGGRTKIGSQLINWVEGGSKSNFESIDFNVINALGDGTDNVPKQAAVVKQEGKSLVYFDFGSGKDITNTEVTAYLKEVGASLKADRNKKISIVGHTDSKGDASANKRLGNNRAVKIKKMLIGYGAKWSQISTSSQGEEAPIATNDTDAGRAKNRRAEIIF